MSRQRPFVVRFVRDCWTVVVPLVLCMAGGLVLLATGHRDAAWFVGNVGPVVVMLLNVVYVLVWDPRGRWRRTP